MTADSTNPVADIFDNDSDWFLPSPALCKRENIYPNLLAYSKGQATLVLILKRAKSGSDFALSQAGLLYLEAMLETGTLKDDSPVRAAFVVLADIDLKPPLHLRVVSQWSAEEMRIHVSGLQAVEGKFGPYWWIAAADTLTEEDSSF